MPNPNQPVQYGDYNTVGLAASDIDSTSPRRTFFESTFQGADFTDDISVGLTTGTVGQSVVTAYIPGITASGSLILSTTRGAGNLAQAAYGPGALTGRYSKYRGRIEFSFPQLSTAQERFTVAVGQFQTVNGPTPTRNFLTLAYPDVSNGGKFEIQVAGATPSTIDTGVVAQVNKIYAFDYAVTVTTPGTTASNPYVARLIDVASGVVLFQATGNMVCGRDDGQSLDTSCANIAISKQTGTTPCTLFLYYMKFEGLY